MLDIGIETDLGLFYEGRHPHGRAIWPNPFVTPARIAFASEGPLRAEHALDIPTQTYRFREDFFDPVSHIRRGRFYVAADQQPMEWHVQPHPAMPLDSREVSRLGVRRTLATFRSASIWANFLKDRKEQPLVVLGLDDRFTIWAVTNLEVISTGEELVTLKARRGIGVLPDIDDTAIPVAYFSRVHECLEAFVDEVHRSAPISVIDRARDAASQALIAYFGDDGRSPEDLSRIADRLKDDGKLVALNIAKLIALLHARGKPTEREKRPDMRPITEEDARLVSQCLGTLLCEIGWADWKSL